MTAPAAPQLVRLIYKSRSALEGAASDVEREFEGILRISRRRNVEEGVTGALMFTRLLFVQALEGPAEAVESVFDRICSDVRHTGVEVVEYGPVGERGFGEWSMSHLVPDGAAEALLDGRPDAAEPADAATSALKLMAVLLRAPDHTQAPRRSA